MTKVTHRVVLTAAPLDWIDKENNVFKEWDAEDDSVYHSREHATLNLSTHTHNVPSCPIPSLSFGNQLFSDFCHCHSDIENHLQ